MELQATALPELNGMLEQKSRDGCTHFSPGLYGRTSASKDISSYDAVCGKGARIASHRAALGAAG
jgi:hypothetical protein